jgi:hypothetical protein
VNQYIKYMQQIVYNVLLCILMVMFLDEIMVKEFTSKQLIIIICAISHMFPLVQVIPVVYSFFLSS